MRDEKTLYWIWLSERCGAASKEFGRLIEKYDDPFDVYSLEEEEIEHLEGIGNALKGRLCDKSLESAYSIVRYCQENRVEIITYGSVKYPDRLKRIETPPVLLYCLGRFPDFNNKLCIGIVGTREMSEYGEVSAYKISYELAASNTVIVSGMAKGVDAVSACGAIEAGGETVAVLGSGISVVYPKNHEKLMKAISRRGAVITEYSPLEPPNARNFPKRNRIISGLCQGVVVVEGNMRSGALITASRAIAQGREVFALPGKINDDNSEGPNELIKNGAYLAQSSDDILNFYDFLYHGAINYKGHTKAKKHSAKVEEVLSKYGVLNAKKERYSPKEDFGEALISASDIATKKAIFDNGHKEEKKKQSPVQTADHSEELLMSLDDTARTVFENMPIDKAVSADAFADTGLSASDIMTAFTMLELNGLIAALPGGLYIRK